MLGTKQEIRELYLASKGVTLHTHPWCIPKDNAHMQMTGWILQSQVHYRGQKRHYSNAYFHLHLLDTNSTTERPSSNETLEKKFSALLQPEVFDASRPSNDGPRDPAAGKDGTIREFAPSALGPRILLRRQKSAPTIPSFRHRECVGHWSKFRPSSIDPRLQIWPLFYLNLLPAARRQHVLAHRATVTL